MQFSGWYFPPALQRDRVFFEFGNSRCPNTPNGGTNCGEGKIMNSCLGIRYEATPMIVAIKMGGNRAIYLEKAAPLPVIPAELL